MASNLVGIEPFVAVAETLSFKAAAARLGVSTQAVSRAIQRLEAELGTQLLHRTTRRVTLAAEGERYLTRCQSALSELRTARLELELARTVAKGTVTVSASFVLGRYLSARLPQLLARYPSLSVSLRLTDKRTRLADEGVDVALRIGDAESDSLVARKLASPTWVTVAAPGYLARQGAPRTAEDLGDHQLLAFRGPRGTLTRWTFPGRALDIPRTAGARLLVDQGELLVDAALAGAGIAQVFDFMVESALGEGSLVDVLPAERCAAPALFAVYLPGQRKNPRVRAVVDFLAELTAPAHARAGAPRV